MRRSVIRSRVASLDSETHPTSEREVALDNRRQTLTLALGFLLPLLVALSQWTAVGPDLTSRTGSNTCSMSRARSALTWATLIRRSESCRGRLFGVLTSTPVNGNRSIPGDEGSRSGRRRRSTSSKLKRELNIDEARTYRPVSSVAKGLQSTQRPVMTADVRQGG